MHPDPKRQAALQHVRTILEECLTDLAARKHDQVVTLLRAWDTREVEGLPPVLFEVTVQGFQTVRTHLLNGEPSRAQATLERLSRVYLPGATAGR